MTGAASGETDSTSAPLAVLIDADNASADIIEGLLTEIAKLGVASVKRIYGDWTNNRLNSWKEQLLDHSIQPVQQFAYTTGKNATDSAMIIDAMDLLYTGRFGGFCIVSSDSDFTRLAARIRESGIPVYGFGERKTPKPFVTACDRFTYTEVFREAAQPDDDKGRQERVKSLRGDARLVGSLRAAIDAAAGDDSWATLSAVGNYLNRASPDFDPRNHGFGKLKDLVSAVGLFDLEQRGNQLFIKDKRNKPTAGAGAVSGEG